MPKPFNEERICLFNTGYWDNQIPTCKSSIKLEAYLTPYTKINSNWIKNLTVRPKTTKLLEENKEVKHCDLRLIQQWFLIHDTKRTSNNNTNKQTEFFTIKNFVFWYNFAHSQTCHIILSVPFSFSLGDIHHRARHPSGDKLIHFLEISKLIKLKLKVIFKKPKQIEAFVSYFYKQAVQKTKDCIIEIIIIQYNANKYKSFCVCPLDRQNPNDS